MSAPYVSGAAALYKAQHPFAMPSEVIDAILKAGSTPTTTCDDGAHGYFTGDADALPEPLLYRQPSTSSAISPVSARSSN
jgi:subtilisin family serine protease